jgi:uncharacterized membrane protein
MLHCLYGFSLAVLLMEALFIRHHKIPFACSYLPGKARAHIFWLLYFVSFILYVSLVSRLELALLQKPSLFFLFGCNVLLLYIALKTYQHYSVYKKMALAYEEEPEPVMVTLRAYNS